jgi:hypothetical protein
VSFQIILCVRRRWFATRWYLPLLERDAQELRRHARCYAIAGCRASESELSIGHRALSPSLGRKHNLSCLPANPRRSPLLSATSVVYEIDRPVRYLPCCAAHCHANNRTQEVASVAPVLHFEATLRALALPCCLPPARCLDRSRGKERLAIRTIVRSQLRVLSDALGASQCPLWVARSVSISTPTERAGIPRPLPLPLPRPLQPGLIRPCSVMIVRRLDAFTPLLVIEWRRARKRPEARFQRAQLAAVRDARGTTSRRAWIASLRKRESLAALAALHEFDDHAMLG